MVVNIRIKNGMFGKHHSLETRKKMSEMAKKRKVSPETGHKISKALKGKNTWSKGRKLSIETRLKMSRSKIGEKHPLYGKKRSEEVKRKVSIGNKGKKRNLEVRMKMRNFQLKRVREGKHNSYKGGITPINKKIRASFEYTLWREAVFKRDNYTCIWCGDDKGGNLEADHIKPFALYPELRFAIDNGRTLCHKCHQTTETYGNKEIYYQEIV